MLPARVSVLTTSFNHGQWIRDTLNSVSCQTFESIEHIVVDDGSTDDSIERLAAFRSQRALKWYAQQNQGQARALNRAFQAAEGEIIGWISSDDAYFSPEVVARVVAAFDRDPSVVGVYGHGAIIDANGRILQMRWAPPPGWFFWKIAAFVFIQPAFFVRRSALSGYFVDEGLDVAMDTELLLRVRRAGRLERIGIIISAERHHARRKSYVLAEVAAREHGILFERGLEAPHDRLWRARMVASRVAYRALGASLIRPALRTEKAFRSSRTSGRRLLGRQLLARRGRL